MMLLIGLGMPEVLVLLILAVIGIAIAIVIFKFVLGGGWDQKACPHCAEKIKGAARVCRFCGRVVAIS